MNALIISIVLVLVVIFLIISLDAIINHRLSYIVTEANDTQTCIEAQIRLMLKQNPNSEVIVIDKTQNDETKRILEMLSSDFPEIHIIKADSD